MRIDVMQKDILIFCLFKEDKSFPHNLLKRKDCPSKIYVATKEETNLECLNSFSFAMIGARRCSIQGAKIATQISGDLCKSRSKYC